MCGVDPAPQLFCAAYPVQPTVPRVDEGERPSADIVSSFAYAPLIGAALRTPPTPPITIDGHIVIFTHQLAASGKGIEYSNKLIGAIGHGMRDGSVAVAGEVDMFITHAAPAERIPAIVRTLGSYDPSQPIYVVVGAGDGTAAEVGEAIRQLNGGGRKLVLVPTHSGTAGDIAAELAVPKPPVKFLRFLAEARRVKLDVYTASFDGGNPRFVLQSQGNGASGKFFGDVAEVRTQTGRVTVGDHLAGMGRTLLDPPAFKVSVNGGEPVIVAEAVTLTTSTRIGKVTRIPLPEGAARTFLLPVYERSLGPLRAIPSWGALGSAFFNAARYTLAMDERVIAAGQTMAGLEPSHTVDIRPGEQVKLQFTNLDGSPVKVPGVLNGDPSGKSSEVVITGTGEKINSLAGSNSAYMVRMGLAGPRSPGSRFISGAASLLGGSQRGLPMIAFGLMDLFERRAGFNPDEQQAFSTGRMAGVYLSDAVVAGMYGTIPLVVDSLPALPVMIGGAEIAGVTASWIRAYAGIAPDSLTGDVIDIGARTCGGVVAFMGVKQLVGSAAWRAGMSEFWVGAVRYIGGAGLAMEDAFIGAMRLTGRAALSSGQMALEVGRTAKGVITTAASIAGVIAVGLVTFPIVILPDPLEGSSVDA